MAITRQGTGAAEVLATKSSACALSMEYSTYLDKVYGGWLGKCIGGTIGARFEGVKSWIELDPDALFPEVIPPNDDLDLQVLWLGVLEKKGMHLSADDLAQAWVELCWYPFCEYGIFRRNWRLGIHPPMSGRFNNQFWEHGMGCPIRSEIWGYVFPGRPEQAVRFAGMDGSLDHTGQSIAVEKMLAAMASMAFYRNDLRALIEANLAILPAGSPIERQVQTALQAYDEGLSLYMARERVVALGGFPEACDILINVPIIILALLYGKGDLKETILAALRCGYDTDCTMATAGAFVGQVLGAQGISADLRDAIGDELVMGIEYRREDMTISGLARDTARMGVLLAADSDIAIEDAPEFAPLPLSASPRKTHLTVEYAGLPCAAPGDAAAIRVNVEGSMPHTSSTIRIETPEGWDVSPREMQVDPLMRKYEFMLHAPHGVKAWPRRNLFRVLLGDTALQTTFGVAGAGLWYALGAYFHLEAPEDVPDRLQRAWHHHFASIDHPYLPEPEFDIESLYETFSRKIGKPAMLASYEHEIELDQLIGLRGPYCAYLARTIIAKRPHQTHIVIGNTDSFRLFLNGEYVGERDEHIWWTPQNNSYLVSLKEGPNLLVVKLLKQDSRDFRFTLGFRPDEGLHRERGQHFVDWDVELSDGVMF